MEAKLGRPVLEVLSEHADREEQSSRERLEVAVYISTQGVVGNDRGKFEVDENNPAFEMLERDVRKAKDSIVSFLTVELKAETIDAEVKKAGEGAAEEAAAERAAAEQVPAAEEPAVEVAVAEVPTAEAPATDTPVAEAAAANAPEAVAAAANAPEASAVEASAEVAASSSTETVAEAPSNTPSPPPSPPPEVRTTQLAARRTARRTALLISGAAGSGKSTFLTKLLAYLRADYRKWRLEERNKRLKPGQTKLKQVVVLLVSLGALQNPMTDLWAEGLKMQYKLTQAQCDELREKVRWTVLGKHKWLNNPSCLRYEWMLQVRTGEAEVLFLLDAYDEMSAGHIGKSLYQVRHRPFLTAPALPPYFTPHFTSLIFLPHLPRALGRSSHAYPLPHPHASSCQANNLEQYRSDEERRNNDVSNPVVIYTGRSELFDSVIVSRAARTPHGRQRAPGGDVALGVRREELDGQLFDSVKDAQYDTWFLPLEPENTAMDETKEVKPYFLEIRLAPFSTKLPGGMRSIPHAMHRLTTATPRASQSRHKNALASLSPTALHSPQSTLRRTPLSRRAVLWSKRSARCLSRRAVTSRHPSSCLKLLTAKATRAAPSKHSSSPRTAAQAPSRVTHRLAVMPTQQ